MSTQDPSPESQVGENPPKGTEKRDADSCIALGAGVGALGAISGVMVGAVCPMCYIVAPGLVAVGVYKRFKLRKTKPGDGELK